MIRKKDEFGEKNRHDAMRSDNAFTRAVKKAGKGGEEVSPDAEDIELTEEWEGKPITELSISELKARDELMRAKEARNETTSESEQFRRDES